MSWFKTNSYSVTKMILNQFGIAVMSLLLITVTVEHNELMLIASFYSAIFYVVLLYMMTWELGAKDRIRADARLSGFDSWHGVKLSLVANIPNFLIALFMLIGFLFGNCITEEAWAQGMYGITHTIAVLWESMYTGFINTFLDPETVSSLSPLYFLAYCLTPLPAILASGFGYLMGGHNRRIFGSLFSGKRK